MTDAYIEGFCKTAEQYGVDPEALIKMAGWGGALARIGGAVRRGARRFGRSLMGTDANLLRRHAANYEGKALDAMNNAAFARSGSAEGLRSSELAQHFSSQAVKAHQLAGKADNATLNARLAALGGLGGATLATTRIEPTVHVKQDGPIPNRRDALEADAKSRGLAFQPM